MQAIRQCESQEEATLMATLCGLDVIGMGSLSYVCSNLDDKAGAILWPCEIGLYFMEGNVTSVHEVPYAQLAQFMESDQCDQKP